MLHPGPGGFTRAVSATIDAAPSFMAAARTPAIPALPNSSPRARLRACIFRDDRFDRDGGGTPVAKDGGKYAETSIIEYIATSGAEC
jgi:hypothetical protein